MHFISLKLVAFSFPEQLIIKLGQFIGWINIRIGRVQDVVLLLTRRLYESYYALKRLEHVRLHLSQHIYLLFPAFSQ